MEYVGLTPYPDEKSSCPLRGRSNSTRPKPGIFTPGPLLNRQSMALRRARARTYRRLSVCGLFHQGGHFGKQPQTDSLRYVFDPQTDSSTARCSL